MGPKLYLTTLFKLLG